MGNSLAPCYPEEGKMEFEAYIQPYNAAETGNVLTNPPQPVFPTICLFPPLPTLELDPLSLFPKDGTSAFAPVDEGKIVLAPTLANQTIEDQRKKTPEAAEQKVPQSLLEAEAISSSFSPAPIPSLARNKEAPPPEISESMVPFHSQSQKAVLAPQASKKILSSQNSSVPPSASRQEAIKKNLPAVSKQEQQTKRRHTRDPKKAAFSHQSFDQTYLPIPRLYHFQLIGEETRSIRVLSPCDFSPPQKKVKKGRQRIRPKG